MSGLPVTKMRLLGLSCALMLLAAAQAPASGQVSADESGICPAERLSIYYARGEAVPTAQAKALMARIGQEALACHADSIDLLADIDTTIDGEANQAVALALARLNSVADALIAEGVPADRIRVLAQSTTDMIRPPMREVGVMFRKAPVEAGEASVPKVRTKTQHTRDAI